ncbi:MAG: tRNA uridine-5-carboxymethylaminomethyl(34) synthesis GTPase MnmE, partial [Oscillospiraceae bacterium]|nr:tRNA uridine-5-carboxymethylaminomethyl(34) synthesis GTPase MnmE [Oscillospiraceae bacterium]
IITNLRQKEALARAFNSLENALEAMETGVTPDAVLTETENSMYAIGELNGKTVREDITNRIFERFCVGK